MIIKKIQKLGNSYAVYVPATWVKRVNKGEVELFEKENGELSILPVLSKKDTFRETTIRVTSYDFDMVNRLVGYTYSNGYDKFRLIFPRELTNRELSMHKKVFEERGINLSLQTISGSEITFYCTDVDLSPLTIFNNTLGKVVNCIRAKEQKEKELFRQFKKELWKDRHAISRMFIKTMETSELLQKYGVKTHSLWMIDNINSRLDNIVDYIEEEEVKKEDLEALKKTILSMVDFSGKLSYDYLMSFDKLIKKIESSEIRSSLKRIERQLVSEFVSRR